MHCVAIVVLFSSSIKV